MSEPSWVGLLRLAVTGEEVSVEYGLDQPFEAMVSVRSRHVASVRSLPGGELSYRRLVPSAGLGDTRARATRLKVLNFLSGWEAGVLE